MKHNYQFDIAMMFSGGVDSAALLALLLKAGKNVICYSLGIYASRCPKMWEREKQARKAIADHLESMDYPGKAEYVEIEDAEWIWQFSPDGVEIARRNRYLIDWLIARDQAQDIALGEYIGADTWVVRDHVGAADADSRALASYLFIEWGLDRRLWTLSDFGEARYKADRVRLLSEGMGGIFGSALTTNCMRDEEVHCGTCYKCLERHAAFVTVFGHDPTIYLTPPAEQPAYPNYLRQFAGENVTISGDGLL